MSITAEEFDSVVGQWKEWQSYPWGKLLYSVSRFNLRRHLGQPPLRILDVGGGNGVEALYYAKQGHTVTLLDYSPAMLAEARQAAEAEGLAEKITFCQADAAAVQELFAGQQFDLILCNLMLEFVAEPRALLRKLCAMLAPGGLFSTIDANRYSDAYRVAFQQDDLAAALSRVGVKDYFHPWFNRITPLFSAHEMAGYLQAEGCALAGNYGVLCICAYLPNARKTEAQYFADLERLELQLTDTYPYYLLARFYQVVVQKAK